MTQPLIEMPSIDPESPGAEVLKAFRDQTPIVRNGRRCIVTDVVWPKGEPDVRYQVRYLD